MSWQLSYRDSFVHALCPLPHHALPDQIFRFSPVPIANAAAAAPLVGGSAPVPPQLVMPAMPSTWPPAFGSTSAAMMAANPMAMGGFGGNPAAAAMLVQALGAIFGFQQPMPQPAVTAGGAAALPMSMSTSASGGDAGKVEELVKLANEVQEDYGVCWDDGEYLKVRRVVCVALPRMNPVNFV